MPLFLGYEARTEALRTYIKDELKNMITRMQATLDLCKLANIELRFDINNMKLNPGIG
jgi:hypothetical protein